MRQINVTELRSHLSKYLLSVQHGAEMLIMRHGQVIVRILPPINNQEKAKKRLREAQKHCKIGDIISPVNKSS